MHYSIETTIHKADPTDNKLLRGLDLKGQRQEPRLNLPDQGQLQGLDLQGQ